MATTILQAPVGAGKTESALQRLFRVVHDGPRPFARAWVVLATKRQEYNFRERLIAHETSRRVHFNIEFFNFYELNTRLLRLAGVPPRRINQAARLGLLRVILADLQQQGRLQVYKDIAQLPGFIRVLADFIYELKQNQVPPDTYLQVAREGTAKDHELALIYHMYQAVLQQHHLVDREGEGWLALETVAKQPRLAGDVDLLLVDGYDQFTPVQSELIARLSGRVGQTVVTLTALPGMHELGLRFQQALELLREDHERLAVPLQLEMLDVRSGERHPDLLHLGQTLLRPDAPSQPAAGGVHLIEAPDPAQEVAAVLREIKRLLLHEGVQADDILVAIRDWGRYYRYFDVYRRLYGLPLALHYSDALLETPATAALLAVLDLHTGDFPRRELLDVLRSPYIAAEGLDDDAVDLLERISMQQQVSGRREDWLEAITRAAEPVTDEDGELIEALLNAEQAEQLRAALAAFFDHVTPPGMAAVDVYVAWLEGLIGPDGISDADDNPDDEDEPPPYTLNMLACIRQPTAAPEIVARDLHAMEALKGILQGFLAGQELLRATHGLPPPLPRETFYADLKSALKSAAVGQRSTVRAGHVLATTATDARGLPHRHVFIPGLAEGVFPLRPAEDPLYLDSERERLSGMGVTLRTRSERMDDPGLFYELVSLPTETLTLSRTTVQDGKLWVESHLWRMVRAAFTDLQPLHLRAGEVPPPAAAASVDEALLSLAQGLGQVDAEGERAALYHWLLGQPDQRTRWLRILQARTAEARRLSSAPHDVYSGLLQNADLRAHAARLLGPSYMWSASRLAEYGACGFRFFARRLLHLEALEEPDDEMDQLQLGSLNHAILEETYHRVQAAGLEIAPHNSERALEMLHEVAAEKFLAAPAEFGFRETARWPYQARLLLERLAGLVARDFAGEGPLSKLAEGPRHIYRLEAPFGTDSGPELRIDLGPDVGTIRARGYIDRIDRAGETLLLADYKTGTTKIREQDMAEGRNFQMILYLAAAQALLEADTTPDAPREVAGGLFWHIRDSGESGALQIGEPKDERVISAALDHMARHISQARAGRFPVGPSSLADNGRCVRHCEFHQLCRVSVTGRRKPAGGGTA